MPLLSTQPHASRLERWRGLVDEHWVDFVLSHVSQTVRVARTLCTVLDVRNETADIKTFTLRLSRRFRGFRPGQFVPVRVAIGGIVHERYYSVTSLPGEATLSITVKRIPGGRVSAWLHTQVQAGDVLELGEAGGDFVLPTDSAAPLLLIAGGSGVTPIYSIVRAALERQADADIVMLYYARTAADFAFRPALQSLAAMHRRFQIHFLETGADSAYRFSPRQLQALAPDFAGRQAFVCGPQGLMDASREFWMAAGIEDKFHCEVFAPSAPRAQATAVVPVHFRRSQFSVENNRPSLLETAEEAGLRPASGCRMGICHTCVCTKVSGVVRDRVTGAVDSAGNARIRLCVSEPLGPVTLDL